VGPQGVKNVEPLKGLQGTELENLDSTLRPVLLRRVL
jgi:hypothetical protein